ncbi:MULTISPECIES: EF-P 5-aminopentanol modification-associated protein YfmH [Bacillota]|jgi:predicted Zn-dependent peptidase|uniref:Insulinase family protein n=2 Tax=Amedibacillus TaxID=2749846 RepID=A0A7G9GLL2_9FIRM|nr:MULTISPECIES: pitrilysin family protein [Bacillota]QNM11694.1 insulinase family protein [[Eubacterium] hominis]MCH4285057.1 insulinase family protein [Amedibacillus hominis]RGB56087.1 insulinase family protein [Absiella sp. AM22-9]RGB61848.1 insulinase family protein [Absiella sp. AM10-20]RGB70329.1 insulinase family protein [Absiella sp. AM09-45]
MIKKENKRYQESYVEETLDNGLHVVLWQKPDYAKSLFMMATPLGALDMKQKDENGKEYDFPAGIAHFLEHKMFEMEDGDVMDLFSNMGANVNAFTSYTETVYYFSTTADVIQPLHLLLDFVQDLSITKESVEKEKGIIIQELNMYKQMSDQRLLMETFSSLYKHHPLRYDIGGDAESVTSITLEQLKQCYDINYHPGKMILVGVSAQNPEVLLKEIKKNQQAKTFPAGKKVIRMMQEEPYEPARKDFEFQMDVSMPKLSIAYKMRGVEDIYERIKKEWAIRMVLDATFSSLNPDFQKWLDEGIINDFVGSDVDLGKDYGMMMFYSETNKKEAFLAIVKDIVQKIKQEGISESLLEQLKKRYYGQSLRSLNCFDDIAITMVRNYFDQSDFFASMDVLYDITLQDVKDACQMIDVDNFCVIDLLPENK